MKTRYCRVCQKHKEDQGFAPSEANGSYGKCKECTKSFKLFNRYGITQKDYDAILLSQNGTCYVCKNQNGFKNKKLCVDHNHETGKVRGLLCDYCNTAIGYLKADKGPELIQRALDYVTKHSNG